MAGSGVGTLEPTLRPRAHAGDARAQWQLSERLHACSLALGLAQRTGEPNEESEGCQRDGIRVNDEWRDWRARPSRLAIRSRCSTRRWRPRSRTRPAPEQFESAAALAARSHDPEAQIVLGHLLMRGGGEGAYDGLAWLLVACPDCMADDARLGLAGCVDQGACPSNMRFIEWLAAEEGQEAAQEVAARAESLTQLYD